MHFYVIATNTEFHIIVVIYNPFFQFNTFFSHTYIVHMSVPFAVTRTDTSSYILYEIATCNQLPTLLTDSLSLCPYIYKQQQCVNRYLIHKPFYSLWYEYVQFSVYQFITVYDDIEAVLLSYKIGTMQNKQMEANIFCRRWFFETLFFFIYLQWLSLQISSRLCSWSRWLNHHILVRQWCEFTCYFNNQCVRFLVVTRTDVI
jgi:hypothetical protein